MKEFTDGKLIRKNTVDMGITRVRDVAVAMTLLGNLTQS